MQRRQRWIGVTATVALTVGGLALASGPAAAVGGPEVVAEGLDNPFKLSFSPDGDLYVTEAGTGGEGPCVDAPAAPGDEPLEACFGLTGAVTRVLGGDGDQERVAEGLPSWASSAEAVGPADVAVDDDGTMYVAVGLGGNVSTRAAFGDDAAGLGTIMVIPEAGEASIFADLAQFEADEDPDAELPGAEAVGEGGDSNPYGLAPVGGGLVAVDAGGNSVLFVSSTGEVELLEVLPGGEAEAPPFLDLPPGTMIPYQSVPTAVEAIGGQVFISELTGFPFPPGRAGVYAGGEGSLQRLLEGFTTIVDLAFSDRGLFVAELTSTGLASGLLPDPRITQLRSPTDRRALLNAAELGGTPTGVAVGPDGLLYVSLGQAGPGGGSVVRFDPTVSTDAATAAACPLDQVPGTTFTDTVASVHREAIGCLAWWGAVGGVTDEVFAPDRPTTRGQVAAVLARSLEAAGIELPASPPDAFGDDDGTTHEARIDQLADLGVLLGYGDGTVRPGARVSRAELATMLVRAHDAAFDDLPDGPDAFDDDGGTHERSIDAAAAVGWVQGTGARTFAPARSATRAQLSSMVARMLATLVVDEDVALPAAPD